MVAMHLILSGMIKVKGQLGEMAKCLEDEPQVTDLAKLFFTELSTKDSAIYNNLPVGEAVVILFGCVGSLIASSHWSFVVRGPCGRRKSVRSTMCYIFSFIEKVTLPPCCPAHRSPITTGETSHRKNKLKILSKSSANASASLTTLPMARHRLLPHIL